MGNNINFIKNIDVNDFGRIDLVQKDEQKYAIKKISISKNGLTKNKINELKKIIKSLAQEKNQHLIQYNDAYVENDYFCIFMEYIKDSNLKQFIKKCNNNNQLLEENVIKDIILQICKGLEFIYSNNLIYYYFSEENIFITDDNKIKIDIFGGSNIYNILEGDKKEDVSRLTDIIYNLLLNLSPNISNNHYLINVAKYNRKWHDLINSMKMNNNSTYSNIEAIYNEVKSIKLQTIVKKLGEGGFGEVNLIKRGDEYYALKKLSLKGNKITEENINKNKDMINYLSILNNKYIIKYYDYYIEKDYLYILMEYGGDLNLKHFIKKYKIKNQLIDIDIIIYIFEQICIGLNGIHNANLIHRDLKPENILINEKYEIKICDFGISKKLNVNEKYAKSSIGGSLYYLSPERFKEDKYDNKVDIYALGCILYEFYFK